MKIVEINALENGSTGKVMLGIAETAVAFGHEAFTFSGSRKTTPKLCPKNHFRISSSFQYYIHRIVGECFSINEKLSIIPTIKLIRSIKRIRPDLIQLHIIHGQYLNIKILFQYLDKLDIPVVWTFHDCWAFTGRCPHFQITHCNKWMSGCKNCPYPKRSYPASAFDFSARDWKVKKQLFTNIKQLTIVTPSLWLADIVKKSFFQNTHCQVIRNGIDLTVFHPMKTSLFNDGKFTLLGVASNWGKRKGLDVFLSLAERLDNNYRIVLIGTDEMVDALLPDNICSVRRTHNQDQLAEYYSSADIFVNPTREDTFPTVNMESLACGTPVITFDTGGSPEIIDETCGSVVPVDDVDALEKEIIRICTQKPFSKEACRERALQFEKSKCFQEYISLYEEVMENE